jgi:FMN phosphatase YigB (HAD superfamily)
VTPQAFLFDVFGTCVDWRSGIARALEATIPHVDAMAFADAWRAEYQPAMARIRDGGRGYVALDDLHLENLLRIAQHGKVTVPDPADLARAWERPELKPATTVFVYSFNNKLSTEPLALQTFNVKWISAGADSNEPHVHLSGSIKLDRM